MQLKIGENIKFYRKSRDITQEELAEMLGVSCQSVSRWELGVCYPDTELLPEIAGIFDISVDHLLGVDAMTEREKVNKYLGRFQEAISKGKIYDCIDIAREGVAEYPNNFTLLNKLMYALFVSGDSDGNIPEWKENMEKYDAEIVALGERIIKYCKDQDIRLEATSRLAFQHCEMGRKSMGRSVYETLPSQKLCRENQMWWCLEDEEELPFLRDKIEKDFMSLRSYIWSLASSDQISDKESITVYEKVFELENLVCDGSFPQNTWGSARLHCEMAELYASLGDEKNMYDHLKTAAVSAKAFDNRPDTQRFSCILLGGITRKRTDFETADTRPVAEIMRDKWLADSAFDSFRDTDEFKEIISSLGKS